MNGEERKILREALIKIDHILRQGDKVLVKMMRHTLEFTVSIPKLRNDVKMAREILQEIPKIKRKLLEDLKMPEMEKE